MKELNGQVYELNARLDQVSTSKNLTLKEYESKLQTLHNMLQESEHEKTELLQQLELSKQSTSKLQDDLIITTSELKSLHCELEQTQAQLAEELLTIPAAEKLEMDRKHNQQVDELRNQIVSLEQQLIESSTGSAQNIQLVNQIESLQNLLKDVQEENEMKTKALQEKTQIVQQVEADMKDHATQLESVRSLAEATQNEGEMKTKALEEKTQLIRKLEAEIGIVVKGKESVLRELHSSMEKQEQLAAVISEQFLRIPQWVEEQWSCRHTLIQEKMEEHTKRFIGISETLQGCKVCLLKASSFSMIFNYQLKINEANQLHYENKRLEAIVAGLQTTILALQTEMENNCEPTNAVDHENLDLLTSQCNNLKEEYVGFIYLS